ncbi:MAG: hypothetical protein QGG36_19100 [Pirellulaceae bacterium]|jgi:hypothetical protein|nr:hypothetical protein [Pirellulaceae bacterium]MDP7017921.1 hypothetical protein [Pirellulaceae bacterium]
MSSWIEPQRKSLWRSGCWLASWLVGLTASVATGQRYHNESPINYSDATADNCVTRLQAKIDSGKTVLQRDDALGYLPAVLKEFNVPASSQSLVFSKTSKQAVRISPRRPRAIYFNDDVYVGWVQRSNLMEVAAVDAKLGAVFYTLEHTPAKKPQFKRDGGSCLVCHATSQTGFVPGHVVFSVYTDSQGSPVAGTLFSSTNHTSPFQSRWGGWYVSGKHGKQRHLGNNTMRVFERADQFDREKGANLFDLSQLFDVKPYLTPHSDLVALMVLEHQAMVHNRITAAGYRGQIAGEAKSEQESELADLLLEEAIDQLVDSLLLASEAPLSERISGTSGFAKEFAAQGPVDSKGRSLRELDLERRLFRYPCSYLIYGEAFDGLPQSVRQQVYKQLWRTLSNDEPSGKFRHVSAADRRSIIEILRDTKPELAAAWAK